MLSILKTKEEKKYGVLKKEQVLERIVLKANSYFKFLLKAKPFTQMISYLAVLEEQTEKNYF